MSPHGRHIIYYTSMIDTMQHAYHICNGIGPTVIFKIASFGHVICLTKILGRGRYTGMIFAFLNVDYLKDSISSVEILL